MIKTAIGLILLLSPYLLTRRFSDKRVGFSYITAFIMTFQLAVGILTQALHVFTYPVILAINLVVFLAVMFESRIDARKLWMKLKGLYHKGDVTKRITPGIRRIDLILVLVVIVLFIQLSSVHYNYSGKYSMLVDPVYKQAQNMVYQYPYFSDEWYAVAFIKYSIRTQSLPFANPLDYDKPFINLEFPFHSFLAEIMLLLDMDPLTQYTQLTIFAGMLICVLVYLFLRYNKVGRLPAAIASLSVPYIIDGANLPGLWTLIPLFMGTISLLLTFFFVTANDRRMTLFMSIPTLLFYPPLFVFYGVMILAYIASARGISNTEKMKSLSKYLALAIFAAALLSATYLSTTNISEYLTDIGSRLFHSNLIKNSLPQLPIYVVIPIPILILSVFGVLPTFRKKIWLLSIITLGLFFWILYSVVSFRIIFELQRAIFLTSILITIVAGFGMDFIIRKLQGKSLFKRTFRGRNLLDCLMAAILISFFFTSFSYTDRDDWQKLTMLKLDYNRTFMPAAPANRILQPDDLRLFANIQNHSFLSDPWKGTVIGIATDNYPVSTKPGTITNDYLAFFKFMTSDCGDRNGLAISKNIEYVYLPEFDCPGFRFIGSSSEGFHLYRFVG